METELIAIVDTMMQSSFLSNRSEYEDIDQQTSLLNSMHLQLSFVDSLQEDIALYGDSLGLTNDSLAVVKFKLLDSLQYYFGELLEMKEDMYALQLTSLLDVKDFNDNIVTYEPWQENQKIVNHYTIWRGMRQETSEEGLDSLRSIASICLDEAGMAVYQAIHLLPICEWADYPAPENVTCGRAPINTTSSSRDSNIELFNVELSPIPASEILNVEMNQSVSGKFEVFSLKGESVLSRSFYAEKEFTISTRDFQVDSIHGCLLRILV